MSGIEWAIVLLLLATLAWMAPRLLMFFGRHNGADWGNAWLNCLDGVNRLFCRVYHRLEPVCVSLPERGGAVVVANHISGLDPLLILASCGRPLRFVIAREQYDRWWLRWLFKALRLIPVDRDKRPEKALYAARAALADGDVVAIFPQGRIQSPQRPPAPLKAGAVFLASLAGTPIVPLRVEGVRGKGLVLLAILLRSRARVQPGKWLTCERDQISDCQYELDQFLRGASSARQETTARRSST